MGSVSSPMKPEYFDGGLKISELLLAVLWEEEKTPKNTICKQQVFLLKHV